MNLRSLSPYGFQGNCATFVVWTSGLGLDIPGRVFEEADAKMEMPIIDR